MERHDIKICPHNGPYHISRPQRCPVSSENNIRSHHLIIALHWYHCFSCDLGGQKISSRKADQLTLILTFDTLGMAVNCGNKIEFSFGLNYICRFLLRQSHIVKVDACTMTCMHVCMLFSHMYKCGRTLTHTHSLLGDKLQ